MMDKNQNIYVLPANTANHAQNNSTTQASTTTPQHHKQLPNNNTTSMNKSLSSAKECSMHNNNNPQPQANITNKPNKEVSAAALKRMQATDDQPIIDLVPLIPTPQTDTPQPTPNKNTLLSPSNITSTKSRPSTLKEKPKNHKAVGFGIDIFKICKYNHLHYLRIHL